MKRRGETAYAHRMAWELEHGPIPGDLWVLHRCDNPPCVRLDHLFLGTHADNMADKVAKGRQARGDDHYSRRHPERLARGERHGSRTHPERLTCGDRNGSRLHPERMPRGENHGNAKLTEGNVRSIFELRAQGWTQGRLAEEFGVSQVLIGKILSRKAWAHVSILEKQNGKAKGKVEPRAA